MISICFKGNRHILFKILKLYNLSNSAKIVERTVEQFSLQLSNINLALVHLKKLAVPAVALREGWRPIVDYYRTNSGYNTVFFINTLKTFFKNELEHILYLNNHSTSNKYAFSSFL